MINVLHLFYVCIFKKYINEGNAGHLSRYMLSSLLQ